MEAFPLAISLNDLCDVLANYSLSVCKGVIGSVDSFVEMYALNLDQTIKQFACSLTRVLKYVGEAMICADSQTFGWSYYSEQLAKEHQFDVLYAEHVIDTFKNWCERSSVEEKMQVGSNAVADIVLHPALLSMTGKACCGLISQIPEIRFLERFSDVFLEYKVATNFGEIGLQSMEDASMSLMKSEAKTFANFKKVQKAGKSVSSNTNIKENIVFNAEKYKKYKPKEVKTDSLLNKNLKIAEDAKNGAAYIRKLSDGRVRYYDIETKAATPGPTRGSAHVTEYDPNRGVVRGWRESYDHAGNVNRVHPKMMNGKNIDSLHYPHTGKELAVMLKR